MHTVNALVYPQSDHLGSASVSNSSSGTMLGSRFLGEIYAAESVG